MKFSTLLQAYQHFGNLKISRCQRVNSGCHQIHSENS